MDSYDVIAEAVKDYWKATYPQDVVAFFQQKYSWDDTWERCEELVECHGSDDYDNMSFLSDFCEGQTQVKDVVIIPLREVTAFYYKRAIENHESNPVTNFNRIVSKTPEEMAEWLSDMHDTVTCPSDGAVDCNPSCKKCWLSWLREEAEDDKY